jgi:hypothetical protein
MYLKTRWMLQSAWESRRYQVGVDVGTLQGVIELLDNHCFAESCAGTYAVQKAYESSWLVNPQIQAGYDIADALNGQVESQERPIMRTIAQLPYNPAVSIDWQSTDERADGAAWIPTTIYQDEDGLFHGDHKGGDRPMKRLYAAILDSADHRSGAYAVRNEGEWTIFHVSNSERSVSAEEAVGIVARMEIVTEDRISEYLSGIGNDYHSQLLMYESISHEGRS